MLLTNISIEELDIDQLLRPVVFEHLSALLSTPLQYSILLIERAVVSLLRICVILATKVHVQARWSVLTVLTSDPSSLRCETKSTFHSIFLPVFPLKLQPL